MTMDLIKTSLEWVVFAEETADDKCQRLAFDCPQEAVARLKFDRICCNPMDRVLCVSCTDELANHPSGVYCAGCWTTVLFVVSVTPIRSS